jgi:hypothetical protein
MWGDRNAIAPIDVTNRVAVELIERFAKDVLG